MDDPVEKKMEPALRRHRLSGAATGVDYRIVFIDPASHARLHRLASFGLVLGSTIQLLRKEPVYLLKAGQTELALDPEIARDIHVQRANGHHPGGISKRPKSG